MHLARRNCHSNGAATGLVLIGRSLITAVSVISMKSQPLSGSALHHSTDQVRLTARGNEHSGDHVVAGDLVSGHVAAAIDLMSSRMTERWTLSALATEVHLSRSQLVRTFKAALGLSPMAYLRLMRVQQMARLLRTTDLSLHGVGQAVGWTDANQASRCFRRHYGISPTKYRRQLMAASPTSSMTEAVFAPRSSLATHRSRI